MNKNMNTMNNDLGIDINKTLVAMFSALTASIDNRTVCKMFDDYYDNICAGGDSTGEFRALENSLNDMLVNICPDLTEDFVRDLASSLLLMELSRRFHNEHMDDAPGIISE
nr:MAG TPA: hypothetical protein [Bacteriophage sp.]